jgi:malate dehydrogenase (oxaloacetate-decarboxylating)(NADP+)
MRPVFTRAKAAQRRVAYGEGEDPRVLAAAQTVVDEGLARPILVGRVTVIQEKLETLGLRLRIGHDVAVFDPSADPRAEALGRDYAGLVERKGITPAAAARRFSTRGSVAAAMLLRAGEADGALVGGSGDWWRQFSLVLPLIPRRADVGRIYALSGLILPRGPLFICDTHVNVDPTPEQIAEAVLLSAEAVRRFGVAPQVALLSHSSFGSSNSASAKKMREALRLIEAAKPDFQVDGEMHGDAALSPQALARYVTESRLRGPANLLVMPSLDAANIALTLLAAAGDGLPVGPILLGVSRPLHILNPTATTRGIVNMTALCASEARA